MSDKIYEYEAKDIVVEYEARRCIHAAKCVHGLPEVFDPKRNPWIDPALAPADEIESVVASCPTGALRVRDARIAPADTNEVSVEKDGPFYLRGNIR